VKKCNKKYEMKPFLIKIRLLLNLINICYPVDVYYYLLDVLKINKQKNHIYKLKNGLKVMLETVLATGVKC